MRGTGSPFCKMSPETNCSQHRIRLIRNKGVIPGLFELSGACRAKVSVASVSQYNN